jgi:alanyl-tRNA synthetase
VAELLKSQPEHVARRVEALLEDQKKLERRVEDMLRSGGQRDTGNVQRVGDVDLHVHETDLDDREQIAMLADAFRAKAKRAVGVWFATGARPGVHVAVTDDLVGSGLKAGDVANAIAAVSGGKGGGRPHFASAGAGDPTKLALARERVPGIVKELLGT